MKPTNLSIMLRKNILRRRKVDAHPDTLTTMNRLGIFHYRQGNYDTAEKIYEEALQYEKAVFGESHRKTRTTMINLAHVLVHKGNYKAAKEIYNELLRNRTASFNEDDIIAFEATKGMMIVNRDNYDGTMES